MTKLEIVLIVALKINMPQWDIKSCIPDLIPKTRWRAVNISATIQRTRIDMIPHGAWSFELLDLDCFGLFYLVSVFFRFVCLFRVSLSASLGNGKIYVIAKSFIELMKRFLFSTCGAWVKESLEQCPASRLGVCSPSQRYLSSSDRPSRELQSNSLALNLILQVIESTKQGFWLQICRYHALSQIRQRKLDWFVLFMPAIFLPLTAHGTSLYRFHRFP